MLKETSQNSPESDSVTPRMGCSIHSLATSALIASGGKKKQKQLYFSSSPNS